MTEATAADILLEAALFAALGLAAGLAFFTALRLNVGLYVSGGSVLLPAAFHVGRMAALAVALLLVVQCGAVALLAALAGLLVARAIVLRGSR